METNTLTTRLKAKTRELGFALSGVAPATDADGFPRFEAWLDRGLHGEMLYLSRLREARRHPRGVLDEVRGVLMVGMEYAAGAPSTSPLEGEVAASLGTRRVGGEPPSATNALTPHPPESKTTPATSPSRGEVKAGPPRITPEANRGVRAGRIAAYAQGPDYHRFMWDRLNALAAWLEAESPGSRAKAVTDTAPLLERDFARRAGLGWVGKNTMLINTRRGSFFFLGALLTTLELAPDPPSETSHCGTCTRCLDACPTGAFPEPHVLDARKCISYLTIELKGAIPAELREPIGSWLYGCDVCQDVCPWNRRAAEREVAFPHDPDLAALDPVELLGLDADAFRARFKGTSLWRNRRAGLLRNAAIVLGNTGDARAFPALEKALTDPEEVVRDAAAWALERVRQRTSSVKSGLPSVPAD